MGLAHSCGVLMVSPWMQVVRVQFPSLFWHLFLSTRLYAALRRLGLRHLRATWKPTVWIHLGPAQSSLEVKANIQKPKWGWFILGFNTWCGKVVGRCCACVCVLFGIFTEMIKYVDRCKQINAYLQVVRLRRSLFGFNEGQRTANNHAPYTNPPNAKHGDLFLLLRVI